MNIMTIELFPIDVSRWLGNGPATVQPIAGEVAPIAWRVQVGSQTLGQSESQNVCNVLAALYNRAFLTGADAGGKEPWRLMDQFIEKQRKARRAS
jgi:hypothetical protein